MYLQIVGHIFSVTLSGGGAVKTCAYVPTDGGDSDEVTESIPVILESTTGGVRAVVNTLNQIGEYARRRAANGVGGRVYLNYKPISSDAATFRSEVLDARWAWSDEPALRRFEDANPTSLIFSGVLLIRRRNYWEGSRTAIPLTNDNGAGNTSGLTVWAHDDVDSGHDAYLFTTGANVVGDMPTPVEVRIKNISGTNRSYANFWLSNNDFGATLTHHIIEGELRSSGGTVTNSASASAGITPGTGQMVRATVVAGSTAIIWTIPAAQLQYTNGNAFRFLGRFLQVSSTVYATLQLRSGSARIDSNEVEVKLGSVDILQDLGVLELPPGGWGVGSYGSVDLYLYLRCAGSATVDLDYLVFLPAEPRMLRHLRVEGGYSAAANDVIVDDGPEDRRYIDTGSNQYSAVSAEGPALHVVPGVDQRIYIAHDGTGITLNSTLAIQMFYRPRRRTL